MFQGKTNRIITGAFECVCVCVRINLFLLCSLNVISSRMFQSEKVSYLQRLFLLTGCFGLDGNVKLRPRSDGLRGSEGEDAVRHDQASLRYC